MTRKTPDYVLKVIGISFGFTFAFIFLEIAARLLPASKHFTLKGRFQCEWEDLESKIDDSCIFKQLPGQKGRYTKGKFPPFPVDALKSVNDLGQFSSVDFRHLTNQITKNNYYILSIGDSYTEALQVINDSAFHGILNSYKTIDGKKVISTSIGKSGDPLSQYLLNLQYANQRSNLKNAAVIFTIIANDSDESIYGYKGVSPGAYFKLDDNEQKYDFKYVSYNRSLLSSIYNFFLSHSSLGSYLVHNVKVSSIFSIHPLCLLKKTSCDSSNNFAANIVDVVESVNPKRYSEGYRATDIFLENLANIRASKVQRNHTIMVVDADRYSIYDNTSNKSEYFTKQRSYFIDKAKSYGFTVIDMEPVFADHYQKHKQKFEFSNDGHWNSLGHVIVSKEIAKELKFVPRTQ